MIEQNRQLFAIAAAVFFITVTAYTLSDITREPIELVALEQPAPEIGGSESTVIIPEMTFAFPIAEEDWKITSPFGTRVSPIYHEIRHHNGVDISVDDTRRGMPQIVAIADGVIRDNWISHPTRGKYIIIDHGNGMVSSYSHLSVSYIHERRPNGSPWKVKAGEVIGRMGATGIADGAHLHFEMEIDGELVNPMLYLDQLLPEWEENSVQGGVDD